MNTIFMWVVAIGLGGFFIGLMFYSFYLVLFSNNEQTPASKLGQKAKPRQKNQ